MPFRAGRRPARARHPPRPGRSAQRQPPCLGSYYGPATDEVMLDPVGSGLANHFATALSRFWPGVVGSAMSKYTATYGAPEASAAASFSADTVSASVAAGLAGRPAPAPMICR